jgi:hypothetical protein
MKRPVRDKHNRQNFLNKKFYKIVTGDNIIKLFSMSLMLGTKLAKVFGAAKPFQPSLMFASIPTNIIQG